MPTYELAILLRQMPRVSQRQHSPSLRHNLTDSPQPDVISTLKRAADAIFTRGGLIRKLENLGHRELPYKISEHGLVHRQASYFTIQFDTPPQAIFDLQEEYGRDVDIIRRRIFRVDEPEPIECTLHEENLPPAYRKDVQTMMELTKKKTKKPNFSYNSGLDYFPFQK
jgi:small subunit ribosomal protein S6